MGIMKSLGKILFEYVAILGLTLIAFTFTSWFYYGFSALEFKDFGSCFNNWFSILFYQTDAYDIMIEYNLSYGLIIFIIYSIFCLFTLLNIFTIIIIQFRFDTVKAMTFRKNIYHWLVELKDSVKCIKESSEKEKHMVIFNCHEELVTSNYGIQEEI